MPNIFATNVIGDNVSDVSGVIIAALERVIDRAPFPGITTYFPSPSFLLGANLFEEVDIQFLDHKMPQRIQHVAQPP